MLRFANNTNTFKSTDMSLAHTLQVELYRTSLDLSAVTADRIKHSLEKINVATKATYDEIAQTKNEDLCFDTVIRPLINLETACQIPTTYIEMPREIHTDQAVRDVSVKATEELKKYSIEQRRRKDVRAIIQQYLKNKYPFERDKLTIEENRYIQREHMHNSLILESSDECNKHKLNSLSLESLDERNKRKRYRLNLESLHPSNSMSNIKKRLAELKVKFRSNLAEVKTSFEYSKAELIGLSEDWFNADRLMRENVYKVTLKYPDVFPILNYCHNRQTRAKIHAAFNTQCADENLPILLEAVQLRQKMAHISGYKSYSDYAARFAMAKSSSNIEHFLYEMNDRFAPLLEKNLKDLTDFVRVLENDSQFVLHAYDIAYYMNLHKKQLCNIDWKNIREYFNVNKVVCGTLEIFQSILGLRFVKIDINAIWHPEVQYYKVLDVGNGELLGDFYLDLYPREGKYNHAAVFTLTAGSDVSAFTGDIHSRRPHSYAMLCNFPKNDGLSFDEVTTFFHEFGHIMHGICSRTQLCAFTGMKNEVDFVEVPSQMLENWCYDARILEKLSAHKVTGAIIPIDMIQKIKDAQRLHAGIVQKQQLSFSIFAFELHRLPSDQLDTLNLKQYWQEMYSKIMRIPTISEDCHPARIGHLMDGNEFLYGYIYSQVIALDMFYTRFAQGSLNPTVGMAYRKLILEPGATKDAIELVRDFLGREPKIDAYLHHFGLDPEAPRVSNRSVLSI